MKILMVSMPSLHFYRWTEQLQDAGHQIYWFNITDSGEFVPRLQWVEQRFGWKLKWDYPGRIFFKSKFPKMYRWVQQFNENDIAIAFEKYLLKVQPDVVHSFALYVACTPIYSVMKKYPEQKWIYSSWGSDLFYFQQFKSYLNDIRKVLPRVNYMFSDCKRDFLIAKKYGFDGEFLGVFPGGGGYDVEGVQSFQIPLEQRKTITIKGYQGRSGRAVQVLQAVLQLKDKLAHFQIVVFGADTEVIDYINQTDLKDWKNIQLLSRISQEQVLQLFGKSLFYIGNSNSDGVPNTLLEAILAGAFPIQSNPGGVTEEILQHQKNGLLIEESNHIEHIKNVLLQALGMVKSDFELAMHYNRNHIIPKLDFEYCKKEVLNQYLKVENSST
ncbi:MAG: glycosyltransferase family 4 protein [Flavobacterium sp.]